MNYLLLSTKLLFLSFFIVSFSWAQEDPVLSQSASYPYRTLSGLQVKINPGELLDQQKLDDHVMVWKGVGEKKLASNAGEIEKRYVYRIVSIDSSKVNRIFVPKPFQRSRRLSISLSDTEVIEWYNRSMELEEQYLYAKKRAITLVNFQFNALLSGTDFKDQSDYQFSPTVQLNPLGLIHPSLQGLLSTGLSLNMPGELVFLSNRELKNTLGMHIRLCLPLRLVALGVQRSYYDAKLLPTKYHTDHLVFGFGRDGYNSPVSLKVFYRIRNWEMESITNNFSRSSQYSFMLSLNVLNIGNSMKYYARRLQIVAKQKRVSDRRYQKHAAKFGL